MPEFVGQSWQPLLTFFLLHIIKSQDDDLYQMIAMKWKFSWEMDSPPCRIGYFMNKDFMESTCQNPDKIVGECLKV